jgi:hypothetical protein
MPETIEWTNITLTKGGMRDNEVTVTDGRYSAPTLTTGEVDNPQLVNSDGAQN